MGSVIPVDLPECEKLQFHKIPDTHLGLWPQKGQPKEKACITAILDIFDQMPLEEGNIFKPSKKKMTESLMKKIQNTV